MNFRRNETEEVSVNLTPLIDVVFILLIFFMVTTTFKQNAELRLELPNASSASAPAAIDALNIAINATGNYFVNGRQLVNEQSQTLEKSISNITKGDTDIPVTIQADGKASHQQFITVLDALSKLNLNKISIAYNQTDANSQ